MAGIKAAEYVKDGMVVGFRHWFDCLLFCRRNWPPYQGRTVKYYCCHYSSETSEQARNLGIPLKAIDEVAEVDVTVDGADEVDVDFNGIKGGGGALLMEKVVATPTKTYIWVVDESKWFMN